MTQPVTLSQFLLADPGCPPGVVGALEDIASATTKIARLVSRGELGGILGSANSANVQGETQTRLDVISNELMLESLSRSGFLAGVASEEMDCSWPTAGGDYLCLFDPLDGSSNIDVDGSIGTIFSILRKPHNVGIPSDPDYLQPGTSQVAAGFALYGPATVLVLTTGRGVHGFTLNRDAGQYFLTRPSMRIPRETKDFTVNMSNRRYWAPPMRSYVDECMAGTASRRGKDFNMRWVGSMVADVYRVLCQGGVFLYPWDSRDPAKPGKLRLLYEANPMSFIVEQADGLSSTGTERIMEIVAGGLHERCPVVMGSRHEVERVIDYHRVVVPSDNPPAPATSASNS